MFESQAAALQATTGPNPPPKPPRYTMMAAYTVAMASALSLVAAAPLVDTAWSVSKRLSGFMAT